MADDNAKICPKHPAVGRQRPPQTAELFPMEPVDHAGDDERVWVHGYWRHRSGKPFYVDGHWRVTKRR